MNHSGLLTAAELETVLRDGLGEIGTGSTIRLPFHCDYGYNLFLGSGVFLNSNCVILSVAKVTIGDATQIGPGALLLTADIPATLRCG